MIAPALRKIAAKLIDLAVEEEAGHIIASDDVRLEARRLLNQAEMLDVAE